MTRDISSNFCDVKKILQKGVGLDVRRVLALT
jgi:hypothetical protein